MSSFVCTVPSSHESKSSTHPRLTNNKQLPSPPQPDVEAYISIFDPAKSAPSALKSFRSNAKKDSIRLACATLLAEKRFIHPDLTQPLTIPKLRKPSTTNTTSADTHPANPYLTFWAWSCRRLQWCGPHPTTERVRMAHPVLPVLMHHFGCAVPSREALEVLRVLAAGRTVADLGSGNGYWSFMLRRHGVPTLAVDNEQSLWRANWVDDTVIDDGVAWLRRQEPAGGRDLVLLLVYPVVGQDGKGEFTRSLLAAYTGDTVAVVGTQNRNGYTGFAGMTMDQYMEQEAAKDCPSSDKWVRVAQIPLPSFAAKDEALFVFQRGDRAPSTAHVSG
ncbi:hypothetical protein MCOR27_011225 [Pyricularia oryzae]|uniref:Uncharacterized protein n=1 Tax=Pyricularia grisea TaxID=148305 RepID=A0ABQ8NHV7_PYRGI|nr:hypothetical protein MCOR01_009679 [Pyricularia oryzae]KAI6297334.1 hypothetical protein MCOR33_006302 [Pyricularia grisea]KAI6254922.1 hypothetical protein MCOR19_008565 [Pyricularia oryzae]KAI6265915.1 hypothetical protein MCOR27_011225 [Pyricularia oryzae]KAI6310185.1 hypothetical protein MCOR30_011172 [Pyricularia oryzae]